MASTITCKGSSLLDKFGANPPSSPTAVTCPLSFKTFFKAWNVSEPQRNASFKLGAPTGIIINSWKSTDESAC